MKYAFIILLLIYSFGLNAQLQNNNPRVFNVKLFGAKGDNSTNDQTAIQNTINAAWAAPGNASVIYFPDGVYKCSGSFVTSLPGGYSLNSLLYIPVSEIGDSSNRKTLIFRGESPPNFEEQGLVNVKRPTNGVIIYSTVNGSGTTPSLLGSAPGLQNFFGFFNYTNVEFYNMCFRTHNNSGMIGLDLYNVTQERADNVRIDIDSGALVQTDPTGTGSIGFRMPKTNNHAWLTNGKMLISGYETGVELGEHASFQDLIIAATINAIKGGGDDGHSCYIANTDLECNKNQITVNGRNWITIANYNTEHNFDGHFFDFSKDINYTGGSDTTNINIFSSRVIISNVGAGAFVATAPTTRYWYNITYGNGTLYTGSISAVSTGVQNLNSAGSSQIVLKNDETLSTTTGLAALEYFGSTYGTTALRGSVALGSRKNIYIVPGNGVSSGSSASTIFYGGGNTAQERVWINSTGIGVGAAPSQAVHVKLSGSPDLLVESTTASGEAAMSLKTTTAQTNWELFGTSFGGGLANSSLFTTNSSVTGGLGFATLANAPIAFRTNSSGSSNERMTILGGGNVGVNNTSPTSTLQVTGSFSTAYVAKTSTYTATASDYTIDCTSGTFTVTLPTAASITGREYNIVNSGSGTITIATTSSQTFTNITSTPTSLTLAPVGAAAIVSYTVKSNGANWIVIGKVKNE